MEQDGKERFRAFVAERDGDRVERGVRTLDRGTLAAGEVTVRVAWSSLNYKDALATVPDGKVAQTSPLVPGIDLAGEVVDSQTPDFQPGARVLAHGYDLGTSHHGGLAELARVPAGWIVPLPDGLTLREAMVLGTAGYTAGLCVELLERHGGLGRGERERAGPVLVTGATGGVGATAVSILAARGYEVVAATRSPEHTDWLGELGAREVVNAAEVTEAASRPLAKVRWAGAVDTVGGPALAGILPSLAKDAAVAACGNAGGPKLTTTVFPFILRGVRLLGADSAYTPIADRRALWQRLATDLRPGFLQGDRTGQVTAEVTLDELEPVMDALLKGQVRGRTVVRLSGVE